MPKVFNSSHQADYAQEAEERFLLRVLPLVSEPEMQHQLHSGRSQAIRGTRAVVAVVKCVNESEPRDLGCYEIELQRTPVPAALPNSGAGFQISKGNRIGFPFQGKIFWGLVPRASALGYDGPRASPCRNVRLNRPDGDGAPSLPTTRTRAPGRLKAELHTRRRFRREGNAISDLRI
jgi:hypothetical protein